MPVFLFEFMDHPRTPKVLRETLLDVLDYCNIDFRPYYREIAEDIAQIANDRSLITLVELGAGLAPLTRQLARLPNNRFSLIPCDLYPEAEAWSKLEREFPDSIRPEYDPVDFTKPRDWGNHSALILCATLHHIPHQIRRETLLALHESADCVLIFEPVRKTPFSMFLVLFALIPALLTPVFRISRPGNIRRFLFCWLLPIVPLMFVWDGLISCLRQWSHKEWTNFSDSLPENFRAGKVTSTPHAQTIIW